MRKNEMRSVGPFELTDSEFAGMEIIWREDEKQLKNITRRAALIAYRLILKSGDDVATHAGLELIQSVLVQNQSHSRWRNKSGLETGESGETADVEAESEVVRISQDLFESKVRRHERSAFGQAMPR